MKILTASEMQRIDRLTTKKYGVPSLTLMENAARGVTGYLNERFAPLDAHRIVICCGKGNNGGDGMAVARLLRDQGVDTRVLLFGNPADLKGDAAVNYQRLKQVETIPDSGAWQAVRATLTDRTLLVDALLGTGLSKPLEGFLLEVVSGLNQDFASKAVVSVDLPSGMSSDSGDLIGEFVRTDASVTFTAPKIAHVFPPACLHIGDWVVVQIGTPPELLANDPELLLNLTCPEDVAWLAAPRDPESHKGTFGHVLILAGSFGKTGAAALAGHAALRAGAGLVTIATPRSALPVIASLGMEYMTEPLPATDAGTISLQALHEYLLDSLIEGKTVLAVGPGISSHPETAELVRTLVNRYRLPMVIDADGLNAFAGRAEEMQTANRTRVLTPHPGEMARLSGKSTKEVQAKRLETAREFAAARGVYLVLKGFHTLIASPDGTVWANPTGTPGMATGGTGDVLTGLTAGLLAAHLETRPVLEITAAAVYLHGLAGNLAADEFGESAMVAGDVLAKIPAAFKNLSQQAAAREPTQLE
jgi:NAD(P)H-hydrate epimerase